MIKMRSCKVTVAILTVTMRVESLRCQLTRPLSDHSHQLRGGLRLARASKKLPLSWVRGIRLRSLTLSHLIQSQSKRMRSSLPSICVKNLERRQRDNVPLLRHQEVARASAVGGKMATINPLKRKTLARGRRGMRRGPPLKTPRFPRMLARSWTTTRETRRLPKRLRLLLQALRIRSMSLVS